MPWLSVYAGEIIHFLHEQKKLGYKQLGDVPRAAEQRIRFPYKLIQGSQYINACALHWMYLARNYMDWVLSQAGTM